MPTILLNNIRPGGKYLTNLRVGSTEVKYVKRGDGKLFYDILSYYSYGTPSVSLSYSSGNTSAAGGTKSPTLSYSQSKTPVGYSGTNYTASSVTSGATIKYEVTSGSATVNSTSGVVTWGANTSTSERSATIKVTITLNGKSKNTTATVKQNGDTVSTSSISLSSNNYTTTSSECASSGGSCTITAKVTKTWVSGDVTYDKPSLTSSNSGFTIGTINSSYQATGTWAASSSTSRRNTTITAAYSGATSKTVTLYQAANTNTTTEYENPVIESVTAADIPAGGGTTANSYYTVKFYQRKRTKYADGTYSAWSYKYASGTTASTSNITASTTLTGSNLAKTTKSRTKLGSVNITITYNGKTSSSKSVDVYQAANSKTQQNSSLSVSLFYSMIAYNTTSAVSPSLTVKATGKYVWTSGSEEDFSNINVTGYTKSFTISSNSYLTVNSSSGNVSSNSVNSSQYPRSATVTVTISLSGLTKTATATVSQQAKPNYQISITNISSYEGSCTFSTISAPSYGGSGFQVMHFELLGNGTITISNNSTSLQCLNNGGGVTNVTASGTTIYVVQLIYRNGYYYYESVGSFNWYPNQDISISVALVYEGG